MLPDALGAGSFFYASQELNMLGILQPTHEIMLDDNHDHQ